MVMLDTLAAIAVGLATPAFAMTYDRGDFVGGRCRSIGGFRPVPADCRKCLALTSIR
jgi:hypothetical protein